MIEQKMLRSLVNKNLVAKASIFHFKRLVSQSRTVECSKRTDQEENVTANLSKAKAMLPKRYTIFTDDDAEVTYDSQADLDAILNTKQKRSKTGSSLKSKNVYLRGREGVFDIDELITLLREEKMMDIATIKVPKELKYCHYMVLCSATSQRHMKNFVAMFNKMYKIKKHEKDPFLNLDDKSNDWKLIDMGNIILNLFLEKAREFYDVETLWTVGEEFDDKIQKPKSDANIISDIMSKHLNFIEQQSKNVLS